MGPPDGQLGLGQDPVSHRGWSKPWALSSHLGLSRGRGPMMGRAGQHALAMFCWEGGPRKVPPCFWEGAGVQGAQALTSPS